MQSNPHDIIQLFVLGSALSAALLYDLKARRIPNFITLPTILLAIILHGISNQLTGVIFGLQGLFIGIAVLIIPYLAGGMGAGDAKLMGAVGAVLGPGWGFMAFLFTGLLGGLYAFGFILFDKATRDRYWLMLKTFIYTHRFIYIAPANMEEKRRLCYGLPIALGTCAAIAWQASGGVLPW